MLAQVLQTFWAKKPWKSLLIATLDKVIYYIGTFLQGSTKLIITTENRVEVECLIFYIYVMIISLHLGRQIFLDTIYRNGLKYIKIAT
jgi:hypothetical protein